VAPVRGKPLPREPLHELVTRDGAEPFTPRFLPGGTAILFVRFEPDGEGFLHPDLFRWNPPARGVDRITRLADVREADPSPDGGWAVGVRNRNGFSQLVRVDLATGAVSEVTRPSVDVVCAQPRVSPDGTRIVFVRHQGGAWKAVVRELASGREVELPTGDGASLAYPTWGADGETVFASVGRGGFIDVVALAADGSGGGERITATIGAALAPAPSPDGSTLYFLGLQAGGLDLRTVKLGDRPAGRGPESVPGPELGPAVRPAPPPVVEATAAAPAGPGRRYGFGRQEVALLLGGSVSPSSRVAELGVRVGDVVGRLDTLALGAIADTAGPRGGTLAGAWRGWPVAVSVQLFTATENPSRQAREVPDLGPRLDAQRRGVELEGTWQHEWRAGVLELGGGAYVGRVEPAGGASLAQRVGSVSARVTETPSHGPWCFPASFDARFDTGRTGEDSWQRVSGGLEAGVLRKGTGLTLSWRRASVRDVASDLDRLQLGGVSSSILPDAVQAGRILVAPLPAGTLIGEEYEGQKASLLVGGLPLFFGRHRMWDRDRARGEWLRLVGLEWDLTGDPVPLVRLPGFHVTVGVARILDQPFKGVTQGWIGLAWRP